MSQIPDTSAADAMRRFGEAITAAGGGDDLALSTPILTTALSLYESLHGELSLHMPELPEERREYLAEFLVRRVHRDHSEDFESIEFIQQGLRFYYYACDDGPRAERVRALAERLGAYEERCSEPGCRSLAVLDGLCTVHEAHA